MPDYHDPNWHDPNWRDPNRRDPHWQGPNRSDPYRDPRYRDPYSQPDLQAHANMQAVTQTDQLLDALAAGARAPQGDPLAAMLAGWRDEVRRLPDAEVVTPAQADAALGLTSPRPKSRFGLTLVGAVAAAVLCLGGFGAVVYGAAPGDSLYGLRAMLFGEVPARSDAQVVLAAQSQLAQAQQLIKDGDWQGAQEKLTAASGDMETVNNVGAKEVLLQRWKQLAVKVVERDPQAKLPVTAPAPVLPSVAGATPLPGVTDTSVTSPTTVTTAPTATSTPTTPTTPTPPTTVTTPPTTPTAPTSEPTSATRSTSSATVPPSQPPTPPPTQPPTVPTAVPPPVDLPSSEPPTAAPPQSDTAPPPQTAQPPAPPAPQPEDTPTAPPSRAPSVVTTAPSAPPPSDSGNDAPPPRAPLTTTAESGG